MNLNPQNESEDEMELRWMEDDAEVDKYFDDIMGDHNDFFDENSSNYHPDADHEIASQFDEVDEDECERSDFDESMDGDFESGMASAGWGTDEDYE
jgi:hypothetical protein